MLRFKSQQPRRLITFVQVVEDKVIKNHYAAEYIYNAYKNVKTCGVIEEDKAFGIKRIAEPVGVFSSCYSYNQPYIYSNI
jgi:acetaldehyde dehydrogenase/alcohol dehydrogenase